MSVTLDCCLTAYCNNSSFNLGEFKPFMRLFRVWILFLIVPISPVREAIISQSKPFTLFKSLQHARTRSNTKKTRLTLLLNLHITKLDPYLYYISKKIISQTFYYMILQSVTTTKVLSVTMVTCLTTGL